MHVQVKSIETNPSIVFQYFLAVHKFAWCRKRLEDGVSPTARAKVFYTCLANLSKHFFLAIAGHFVFHPTFCN